MSQEPCVLSVAEHAGWANIVCVVARRAVPAVVERRRVTLIDAGLPTQPYHHESINMTEVEANALIARVRQSIAACASESLRRLVSELAPSHTVVALAIRKPPFPELPETVASAWGSRLLYSADGMMYQLAICGAARQLGLDVAIYPRGQETLLAAQRLGVTPGALEHFVSDTGRPAGPPWRREHRQAYAAGIGTLAEHVRRRLKIPTS
jgi:hypothetical protein